MRFENQRIENTYGVPSFDKKNVENTYCVSMFEKISDCVVLEEIYQHNAKSEKVQHVPGIRFLVVLNMKSCSMCRELVLLIMSTSL